MSKENEEYLSGGAAAKYARISYPTLKKCPVPYLQYGKFGRVMYKKSDLDEFIQKNTHCPEPANW